MSTPSLLSEMKAQKLKPMGDLFENRIASMSHGDFVSEIDMPSGSTFPSLLNTHLNRYWLRVKSKFSHYYSLIANNPFWILIFVFGRFYFIRSAISFLRRKAWPLETRIKSSIFEETDSVNDVVDSLKDSGIHLAINLSQETVANILTFTEKSVCYGNGKLEYQFPASQKDEYEKEVGKSFVMGEYQNAEIGCSSIEALQKDPYLLEIAGKYFGSPAICLGNRLWWSFANDNGDLCQRLKCGQELFHYDSGGFQFLRFFFYITDVNPLNGPHICIQGSHKKKSLWHQFTLFVGRSDQAITDYYGVEKIVEVLGKSGFGFAEDMYCFHKGKPPISKDRLILAVDFSVKPG